MPPGILALSSSGFSTTSPSVVRKREAMLAAFCTAERATLAGSTIGFLTVANPKNPESPEKAYFFAKLSNLMVA
jgi:hypothetical protein